MPFSINNFVTGYDHTAAGQVDGASLNAATEQAEPDTGIGLVFYSVDYGPGVPDVPNPDNLPNPATKKRYFWIRVPYNTSASQNPIAYGWNPAADSDATLLKWLPVNQDLSTIEGSANDAVAKATNALQVANTSLINANAAKNSATAASNTANAASDSAQTATDTANTALTAANEAKTNAQTAINQSNTAVALVNSKRDINTLSPSGISGQRMRVNAASNAVEWFSEPDTYVKLVERQAKGVAGGDTINGENTRKLNRVDSNSGNLVTLDPVTGLITFTQAGTYYVRARATIRVSNAKGHQLCLMNGGNTLLSGISGYQFLNGYVDNFTDQVCGIVVVDLVATKIIHLGHYTNDAVAGSGLGQAANVGPEEIYAEFECWKIK